MSTDQLFVFQMQMEMIFLLSCLTATLHIVTYTSASVTSCKQPVDV